MTRRVGSIDRRRDGLAHSLSAEVADTYRRSQAAPFRKEPLWHLLAQIGAAAIVSTIVIYWLLIALTSGARP